MYKIYHFSNNENAKLFFTSDTHFGHDREFIYKVRGFSDVNEHDETLISRWNSVVRAQDHVIHLGDFLVGAGKEPSEKVLNIIKRLNGTIHYIWGNHNAGIMTLYKKNVMQFYGYPDIEVYPLRVENIVFYGSNLLARINKKEYVFCSHFAHRIWITPYDGKIFHLCGHSHGNDLGSNIVSQEGKRLDVGIENFGQPVSYDDIVKIMENKKELILDHH